MVTAEQERLLGDTAAALGDLRDHSSLLVGIYGGTVRVLFWGGARSGDENRAAAAEAGQRLAAGGLTVEDAVLAAGGRARVNRDEG